MTYERFEDLPVWQDAARLAESPRRLSDSARRQERARATARDFERRLIETLPRDRPMREFPERKREDAAAAASITPRKTPCARAR